MVYTKQEFLSLPKMESHFPPIITTFRGKQMVRMAWPTDKWFTLSEDISFEEAATVWKRWIPEKESGWKKFQTDPGKVYKVLSSNGQKEYDVKVVNGNFTCTCVAGGFGRLCKHVKEVKEIIKNQ